MFDPIEINAAARKAAEILAESGGSGLTVVQISTELNIAEEPRELSSAEIAVLSEAAQKKRPIVAQVSITNPYGTSEVWCMMNYFVGSEGIRAFTTNVVLADGPVKFMFAEMSPGAWVAIVHSEATE